MVTIKDMAEILGISTTTVSNVIHGKTSQVSQKTVEKVEKLLEEYEYVPNINARNLANNSSRIIGMVIKGRRDRIDNLIANSFFGDLVSAIEAETRARGYFMMLYISDDINELMRHVSTWNVDGLVMIGILHDDFARIKSRYKKPAVLIDSYAPRNVADYVNVGLDDEQACYDMADYLLENGHRKIAFLADNMEGVDYQRYMGFLRAMHDHGVGTDEDNLIMIHPGILERRSNMREIYEKSKNFTAFMCCSDYYAAMLISDFTDRGVKIPEEVSFTGFDDDAMSRLVRPKLTTIHQNIREKGRVAVDCLEKLIRGEELEKKNYTLPVEMVFRDSVKKITE
ncbi:MAG: LacI family transcriptional regulator [Blautia sp.]|uniref:LacI family DNA-binding transcriptional regulator n=1 Tax=Blautia sp. TaxID=1955243 RepID=UPI0025BF79CC|nr:LacI family DNA-binding transcriptional regulator [Blautia sp.]MCI7449489.1 LacI family transcriptional regulator [Blautia sp.]MDD6414208.1 LacI family DNA-binding transcriptional regulator [Blautia sp.]